MKRSRSRVLVLGSDTRSFLSVVRSLGRAGIEVHAAWFQEHAPALRSRYLSKRWNIPTASSRGVDWKGPFAELLDRERFDLVIPCNDPSLIPLQENRHSFDPQHRIYLLSDHAYNIAFDKERSLELASSLSIPVGAYSPVSSMEQIDTTVAQLGFPLVLKPVRSYDPKRLRSKNHVRTVRSAAELNAALPRMLASDPIVAQQYFAGTGVGVELLALDGRVLVAFMHRRLHEPRAGGGSSYRMSVPLHDELLQAAQQLMAALNYSGVAMVEFRYNFETGQWIFVEINGRFWGSLPLALACRVNFPHYLFQMLVEGRTDFPQTYRAGICCRNIEGDFHWATERLTDALKARRLPRGMARGLAVQMYRTVMLREHCDTLVLDDPLPAVSESARLAQALGTAVTSRLRKKYMATAPARGARKRRAMAALEQGRRILFVCKGNICRSPFAHHYLSQRAPADYEILSCGYFPEAGRVCPSAAKTVAAESGIDLTLHSSQVLNDRLLETADAIFVFDDENWRMLSGKGAKIRRKTHRLGDLIDLPEIQDPFGGDADEFRKTYALIAGALDSWLATRDVPVEHSRPTPLKARAGDIP